MSLKHQEYKEANIRFLEENLQEEGVMKLPCGVQYKALGLAETYLPTPRSSSRWSCKE